MYHLLFNGYLAPLIPLITRPNRVLSISKPLDFYYTGHLSFCCIIANDGKYMIR